MGSKRQNVSRAFMMSRSRVDEAARSIRLNRQWRAIYEVQPDGDVVLVLVKEVMPHDY
jgi:plasmid maintenance system killer protein